jgi:DNA-binding protein HU-beta
VKNVATEKTKKALTKTQVAAHLAEKFGFNKKQAVEVLDELAALATSETKKNDEFTIPGVGKLVKQKRAARMVRNPATGQMMKSPAKTVVKFRVAKAAKDAINPPKKTK